MMIQELDKEEGDRISVSISRKAYDALATYTRQVNEKKTTYRRNHSLLKRCWMKKSFSFLVMSGKKISSV
jgi:hypothetical protein